MGNLYELNLAFNNMMEVLDNTEDVVTKELIKDSIDQLQLQTSEKIENIIKYIKSLEYDIKAIEEETKKLQAKKKTTENKISNLKAYLKDFTTLQDNKKYSAGTFKLTVRKNAPVVVIDKLEDIPQEFIKVEVVQKVDKLGIKERLKTGEQVAGAKLETSESILIK